MMSSELDVDVRFPDSGLDEKIQGNSLNIKLYYFTV